MHSEYEHTQCHGIYFFVLPLMQLCGHTRMQIHLSPANTLSLSKGQESRTKLIEQQEIHRYSAALRPAAPVKMP